MKIRRPHTLAIRARKSGLGAVPADAKPEHFTPWQTREYDWRKCQKLNWVRDGDSWSIQ